MKTYTISGYVETSLVLTVRANSKKEARKKAEQAGIQGLCHQCDGGFYEGEWSTADGLGEDIRITHIEESG